jgi:L-asparaginase II
VIAAMRAWPEMLRGPISADVTFARAVEGWFAKGGAEGLFCAGSPDGLGVALKVEDGAYRAFRPALAAFLRRLGIDTGELGIVRVENSRGETVGVVRTRPESRPPKSQARV